MANRWFSQFRYSLEKAPVDIWAKVSFGATGAPTLSTVNSKGITSITRNSAGKYTIVLQDNYYKFLGLSAVFNAGASGPAAPDVSVSSDLVTSGSIQILCQSGGANTDPASGEVLHLQLQLSNSGAL